MYAFAEKCQIIWEKAYEKGLKMGLAKGFTGEFAKAFTRAYAEGYADGYVQGYKEGLYETVNEFADALEEYCLKNGTSPKDSVETVVAIPEYRKPVLEEVRKRSGR